MFEGRTRFQSGGEAGKVHSGAARRIETQAYGDVLLTEKSGGADKREWQERVKRALRSELTRAGVSYDELSRRLKARGFQDIAPQNLMNKVSRGTFSAVFLFQCMAAIGRNVLLLDGPRPMQPLNEEELEVLLKATADLVADSDREGD